MVQLDMSQQLPPALASVDVDEFNRAEAALGTRGWSLLPEMCETVGEPLFEGCEREEALQKIEGTLQDGRRRNCQDAVRAFFQPHIL